MKVLVVSHTYIAPINREKWIILAEQYSNVELKILMPHKWPEVFFDLYAGDLSKYNVSGCEFISINAFKTGNEVLYGYNFFDLSKLLKAFKPDLIYVEQGDNAFSLFQLIILSKLFCRKSKFIFFTWVNWKHKWSFKYRLVWSFIEKFNLKHCSGAIVGNNVAADILKNKNFLKPIEVLLQLGVNQKYFMSAAKFECKKVFKIGYIGRIIREKGLFYLVDAFEQLYEQFPDWQLVFVGDGYSKKSLINYVYKNNLKNSVEFRDAVSHENVGKVLNEFDIFVLPSYDTTKWREQFGHVLIEAMACKIPVIGSTGGQIPYVINNAGLVFEQKNTKELASCLQYLMKDKNLRNEFAQKGYERFKSNYSYEIIADKTIQFWNQFM